MKKQILFVDDDRFVLAGLRRLLRSHREEWDIAFAEGGSEALRLMADHGFDVIVSDMRMPGMDGAELLAQVRQRYPRTVRIILSGQSDEDLRMRSVGPAHQYLWKPCDPGTLKDTIERACVLRNRLENVSLRRLVSQIESLPSLPGSYRELMAELRSGDPSLRRVAEIISTDLAMTAKVVQLVNSSFFGLTERISSPLEAVKWLGLNRIGPLALTAGIFSQLDQTNLRGLDVTRLVDHSLAVATRARTIAGQLSDEVQHVDDAFLAGMLHDVGKLVLACNLPEQYQRAIDSAIQRSVPLWQSETEIFAATHADVGAYLTGLWGLPDPIVEAIAFHHEPRQASTSEFTPLTAVHVANALERDEASYAGRFAQLEFNEGYLAELGLLDSMPLWREQRESQLTESRCHE